MIEFVVLVWVIRENICAVLDPQPVEENGSPVWEDPVLRWFENA
jgi:hypothetical protein